MSGQLVRQVRVAVVGVPDVITFDVGVMAAAILRSDYIDACNRWSSRTTGRSVLDLDLPARRIPILDLRPGDWLLLPRRCDLPPVGLSFEQLYAAGLWLADGCYLKNVDRLRPAYGRDRGLQLINNRREWLLRVQAVLRDWFPDADSSINIKYNRKSTGYQLAVYSETAACYFRSAFGEYAHSKALAPHIYNRSGLLPLVCGFVDGDGAQISKGRSKGFIVTGMVSERLARQIQQILWDEGVWASRFYDPGGVARGEQLMHQVRIAPAHAHRLAGAQKVEAVSSRQSPIHAIPRPEGFYARVKDISY
ncbi:MAG: hypothetical protein JXB47_07855 [Anaerolineae bacterium]|nr:hypothetical protein [Anaerolineae bacterium]